MIALARQAWAWLTACRGWRWLTAAELVPALEEARHRAYCPPGTPRRYWPMYDERAAEARRLAAELEQERRARRWAAAFAAAVALGLAATVVLALGLTQGLGLVAAAVVVAGLVDTWCRRPPPAPEELAAAAEAEAFRAEQEAIKAHLAEAAAREAADAERRAREAAAAPPEPPPAAPAPVAAEVVELRRLLLAFDGERAVQLEALGRRLHMTSRQVGALARRHDIPVAKVTRSGEQRRGLRRADVARVLAERENQPA